MMNPDLQSGHCIRVYVAGPLTAATIDGAARNARDAIWMGEVLLTYGLVPFIPHLTLLWSFQHPHSHEEWLRYDKQWLEVCDALVRLPGKSPGASQEVMRAKELGIPVYYLAGNTPANLAEIIRQEVSSRQSSETAPTPAEPAPEPEPEQPPVAPQCEYDPPA